MGVEETIALLIPIAVFGMTFVSGRLHLTLPGCLWTWLPMGYKTSKAHL